MKRNSNEVAGDIPNYGGPGPIMYHGPDVINKPKNNEELVEAYSNKHRKGWGLLRRGILTKDDIDKMAEALNYLIAYDMEKNEFAKTSMLPGVQLANDRVNELSRMFDEKAEAERQKVEKEEQRIKNLQLQMQDVWIKETLPVIKKLIESYDKLNEIGSKSSKASNLIRKDLKEGVRLLRKGDIFIEVKR